MEKQMKNLSSKSIWRIIGFATLFAVMAGCTNASADSPGMQVERQLTFTDLEVDFDASREWIELALGRGDMVGVEGAPAMPSVAIVVPLEPGLQVSGVRFEIIDSVNRQLPVPVMPYTSRQPDDDNFRVPGIPDPVVYTQNALYPAETAIHQKTSTLSSGSRSAVIRVFPVQVNPNTNELIHVRRARLVVELAPGADLVDHLFVPKRPALVSKREAKEISGDTGALVLFEQGFNPTTNPSTDGSAVEYVIISPPDEDMIAEWQRLADWKTDTGHPALVVTTDWIEEEYPTGVDLAEKIRFFLRDGYLHWGLKWALLGADVGLVPCRFVGWDNPTSSYPCDYYYACLEGSWDDNGNGKFLEHYEDEHILTDLEQDIQVGRISAKNAVQISDWLNKYFVYVKSPPRDGYLDRTLFLGEVLFHADWQLRGFNGGPDCDTCITADCRYENLVKICVRTDGGQHAVSVAQSIWDTPEGADLPIRFLMERSSIWAPRYPALDIGPESWTTVVDEYNQGYNHVLHIGHASKDRWAIGDGRLIAGELSDNLTNGTDGHYSNAVGVDCSSAALNYDSIGEVMTMLEGHGSISYIGATKGAYAGIGRDFGRQYYVALFSEKGTTLGDGYQGASDYFSTSSDMLLYTRALIGDPGMMVWQGTPSDMVVTYNGSPSLGASTLNVTVTDGAIPVEGAYVCVQKTDEIYATAYTGADGIAAIPFWAETTGEFNVAVTASEFVPYTATGDVVAATDYALVVSSLQLYDDGTFNSIGNDNGVVELGEVIRLRLTVENDGAAEATGVSATWALGAGAPDGLVTVNDGSSNLANIVAGGQVSDGGAFLFTINADPVVEVFGDSDQISVPFDLTIQTSSGGSFVRSYAYDVSRPRLDVALNERVDVTVATINLSLGLANVGQGTASHLKATLAEADDDAGVVFISPTTIYPADIGPGETLMVGTFEVSFTNEAASKLVFTVVDTSRSGDPVVHTRNVDLIGPEPPEVISGNGFADAISLTWGWEEEGREADADIVGYKLYRALTGGPFSSTHPGFLTDHRYATDGGLNGLTSYSYKICSVDAGGNLGDESAIVTLSTSPAFVNGWPNDPGTCSDAAPLICELDLLTTPYGGKNMREIIFGGDKLYGYHGDGLEYTDGDFVGSTDGIFSNYGSVFRGKSAVGDVIDDGDGRPEVVGISYNSKELMCWSGAGGNPLWTITLPYASVAWTAPTIADIDNDDVNEILLLAGRSGQMGYYAFNGDGTPFLELSEDGLIADFGESYMYNSLAVGDIDANGDLDVVYAGRSGRLRVIKASNGAELPGFAGVTLGSVCRSTASLGDVNDVPGDEIIAVSSETIKCYTNGGVLLWTYTFDEPYSISSYAYDLCPNAALGKIDLDDEIDLAIVGAGGKLIALEARSGNMLPNFPIQLEDDAQCGSCILANIDGHARPEIIFGDAEGRIHAYTYEGSIAPGFPIYYEGYLGRTALAAWDVDGDGKQNLIVQSADVSKVTVYDMENSDFSDEIDQNPWPMMYRDNFNTSKFDAVRPPVAVEMIFELAAATDNGVVTLEWQSNESIQSFLVRRSQPGETEAMVIAEINGASEPGLHTYRIEDQPQAAGTYLYEIIPIGFDGIELNGPTTMITVTEATPFKLAFQRVSPQPIVGNFGCTISYTIPGSGGTEISTRLRLFDLQGRQVSTLVDDQQTPGEHSLHWDGRDSDGRMLEAGVYMMRLESVGRADTRRVLLVR
jgi:Peptidase family C25/FG-GAP-like repeat/FlgD Ig-like domain